MRSCFHILAWLPCVGLKKHDVHCARVLQLEIMHMVAVKADKEELIMLDSKLGQRVAALEAAILKGLKAISDKVSTRC